MGRKLNRARHMLNIQTLIYAGGIVGIMFASRIWVKFKQDRALRKTYDSPLFDETLLATVCMPRKKDGDNADVLAELMQTLSHLNRQHYAKEFWDLDKNLTTYYNGLKDQNRPTLRRALIRMVTINDRWLQIVAARTCASLSFREAILPLRGLLELSDSMQIGDPKIDYGRNDSASEQFHREIEQSLNKLDR
jgi:hypothetical protein